MKKIVFDRDGNLLKSFDYSEEIYKHEKNYTQEKFEINFTDVNRHSSTHTNNIDSLNKESSFVRNNYSLSKSYQYNDNYNDEIKKEDSNKLPLVITKNNSKNIDSYSKNNYYNVNNDNINNNKRFDRICEKYDISNLKMKKNINSNSYSPKYEVESDDYRVLNTRNDDDTLLQPLNPSNHDTRLNGLEKKKSINNSSGNSKNKKYDPINLIAINNVGPQLIPSDSMFMRLSKNKSIKPSKINTLLSTIRKENLINEYDSLINDYIFNIPSVSHYDKKNYSSKSIINNVGSNSSSNSISNNNNNNNNKVKEVKPAIDSSNNKKDNWKPICRNSIIYLQNEESNTKAKNNFKSWVISNFEHEWEDQPWISIKCPKYDELEEEETDYYQHSISVKRKSHSNSNIENLPLKVAYLSHTIQHIYRNSSKIYILYFYIKKNIFILSLNINTIPIKKKLIFILFLLIKYILFNFN